MSMRKCDGHGCGHFGASRGSRKHNGVDLVCIPGTPVGSPVAGRVTKLGYAYTDDLSFRYVQISSGGYDFRLFYVEPMVEEGAEVIVGSLVGRAQRLGSRYQGITEHVHFEVKHGDDYVDPTPILLCLRA